MRKYISLGIVALALLVWLVMPSPLPPSVGAGDFRAYWSASYLLTRGENFADPQKVFEIERTQTDWRENYPMVTWNPPWLLALLAPYTLDSFNRAVWWWMLTNIALVFASAKVLWNLSVSRLEAQQSIWIPVLMAFTYSITLTTLAVGQVNSLVLAGLAGYLFFDLWRRDASAGAALALTLVKPQLVYALVPILLLNLFQSRHWRTLAGFSALLIGLTIVVFVLRPDFVLEYFATLGKGQLLNYQTPTLGGWLEMLLGWSWAKLIGVIVLPIAVLIGGRGRVRWNTRTLVDAGLLFSVITAPFLWSYDFIVLLVPLTRILGWVADHQLPRADSFAIICTLFVANLFSLYERFATGGEEYFFWIPLFVSAMYALAYWRTQRQLAYA